MHKLHSSLTMTILKDVLFNQEARWKGTCMNQSYALITKSKDRPQGNDRGEGRNRIMFQIYERSNW